MYKFKGIELKEGMFIEIDFGDIPSYKGKLQIKKTRDSELRVYRNDGKPDEFHNSLSLRNLVSYNDILKVYPLGTIKEMKGI